jgi:polysaccharide biosynthesis/export protein
MVMKKTICFFFACIFLPSLAVSAQKAPSKTNPPPEQPQSVLSQAVDEFVIGSEDVLSINVWKEPDLSVREIIVRSDGRINLPLVDEIQASGMTVKQLQDKITAELKEFVSSPSVTVTITRISSRSVSIIGEVRTPGVYILGSPMTVLELLARAGGFTELAKTKSIRIIRKENGQMRQLSFNYKNIINGNDLEQNILLKNGDSVIVP